MRTLILTQNQTVDGAIEMLDPWCDPAAEPDADLSLVNNAISELGAAFCMSFVYPEGPVPICSPLSPLMNGSFVLFGLLLAVGARLVRDGPRGARRRPQPSSCG